MSEEVTLPHPDGLSAAAIGLARSIDRFADRLEWAELLGDDLQDRIGATDAPSMYDHPARVALWIAQRLVNATGCVPMDTGYHLPLDPFLAWLDLGCPDVADLPDPDGVG